MDFHGAVGHRHAGEVVGGLDQPLDVWAHAVNAHRARLDGQQEGVLVVFSQHERRQVRRPPFEHQLGVGGCVLRLKRGAGCGQGGDEGIAVRLGKHQGRTRLPWNGIAQAAAVDLSHAQVDVVEGFEQHAVHQFVGVGQSFVDVHAAVASRGAAKHEGQRGVAVLDSLFGGIGATGRQVDASRTADADFVVVFGVKVQKNVSREKAALQSKGACHPRFLIDGEEGLERGVGDI